MVKIPGLDDLKKMGSDLLDSAKTVDLSGIVNKLKTGIESVTQKSEEAKVSDEALAKLLQEMAVTLEELNAANTAETTAIKKMQNQLTELTKIIVATYQQKQEEDNQNDSNQTG